MEIEYNRNIRSSNMLIRCTGQLPYMEEEMLLKNQIYGLIPLKCKREDGNVIVYYDITGKQALDVVLESSGADEHLLLLLFSGICGVAERLDKYLLCQDRLLLRPECIFLDYKAEEIYFCYCPENGPELPDAFRKLMEYLLTKTNHKDERAVEIAYEVYEETLKTGYSLEHIKENLHLWKGKAAGMEEGMEEGKSILEEKQNRERGNDTLKRNVVQETGKREPGTLFGLKKYVQVDFWKNKFKPSFLPVPKREKSAAPFVFEPEEEEIQLSRPTVLLAEKKRVPLGILKYEGIHGQKDLEIGHIPYIIGSDPACDGVIGQGTVSRKHAKITKTEDIYFIEDLNSLNGTVAGGELLHYKLKASLEIDEVIEFAGEKYRFL